MAAKNGCAHACSAPSALTHFGDSKVNELERTLHKDKVGWLEVAMDDTGFVDGMHTAQHLLPHEPQQILLNIWRVQSALSASRICGSTPLDPLALTGEHVAEVCLPVFHHDVDALGCVADLGINEADDVPRRLAARRVQPAQQGDLIRVHGDAGSIHA